MFKNLINSFKVNNFKLQVAKNAKTIGGIGVKLYLENDQYLKSLFIF